MKKILGTSFILVGLLVGLASALRVNVPGMVVGIVGLGLGVMIIVDDD